jgi:hypothetical protein
MAAVAAVLAGCGAPAQPDKVEDPDKAPADAGYLAAPALLTAAPAGERVRLEGLAQPGARIRLAPPAGEAYIAGAGRDGRWRLEVPAAPQARIFGLSSDTEGRRLQAQGYVLVTETGAAALLRAGAGAQVLTSIAPPRLLAVDFDHEGAAVVSGTAPPQSAVSVRIDGRPGPLGRADAAGRFSLALAQPLVAGAHQVQILGDSFARSATVDATPATPLGGGPFRATRSPLGLRADWMTPGGGLQSTWILN